MPSEKAKENKTLTALCAGCGHTVSTELIHGVEAVAHGRRVRIPVCDECRLKGWEPPVEAG